MLVNDRVGLIALFLGIIIIVIIAEKLSSRKREPPAPPSRRGPQWKSKPDPIRKINIPHTRKVILDEDLRAKQVTSVDRHFDEIADELGAPKGDDDGQ